MVKQTTSKIANKTKSKKKHSVKKTQKNQKIKLNSLCDEKMSLNDCELKILRNAVDKAEIVKGKTKLKNATIQHIIQIVEAFIQDKNRICYGGTAINNILPTEDQFYRKDIEFPDYDFFSPDAFHDAKELANIYNKNGFIEVEAKSGMHPGTYKVYVNFIPVADITQLHSCIFKCIQNESVIVNKIPNAPPNFLRMSMYLELSRPMGDISRWEKILKRIRLLNKHYPLKGVECDKVDIQRHFENTDLSSEDIFHIVRDILVDEKSVFFGAMAHRIYGRYMPNSVKNKLYTIPDFDVLSPQPFRTIQKVQAELRKNGYTSTKVIKHKPIGELIATHYELKIDKDTILFVYEPNACHSFNTISIQKQKLQIATIDTMLSFYLSFLYSNRPYFDTNRILCMCEYLFKVQQKNRLAQKGLLKRFSISCIGKQKTFEDIRSDKSDLFNALKHNRSSKEYNMAFLRYIPNKHKTY